MTDYNAIQKTARDAAVKAHIAGKTVRDLVLDPVVIFTAETPKEKAHAFRYTVDALRVATDDQKKTVKHACEVIALNVAYAALEMRRTDDAPKVHRREIVERLKEVANALNLGVGAVNKDAALLVECGAPVQRRKAARLTPLSLPTCGGRFRSSSPTS